jgi:hypothetical protein
MYSQMGHPNSETWYNTSTLRPDPTGDGKTTGTTVCRTGGWRPTGYVNTKWGSFSAYPVSGLGSERYPEYCNISDSRLEGRNGYICRTARQMAIDEASALKARFVQIYAIGLGSVDSAFLSAVASGSDFVYITPDSSDLESIFKKIAKEIKLRLVQ